MAEAVIKGLGSKSCDVFLTIEYRHGESYAHYTFACSRVAGHAGDHMSFTHSSAYIDAYIDAAWRQ